MHPLESVPHLMMLPFTLCTQSITVRHIHAIKWHLWILKAQLQRRFLFASVYFQAQ